MSVQRAYEYQHIVAFEETNLVGNVYYVNYLRWQGRCREMFLRELVPGIVADLAAGLAIATVRVSCEFYQELFAFDTVAVRMMLAEQQQNRLTMSFEYWRMDPENEQLVARGEQQVAFLHREVDGVRAAPIPDALMLALRPYLP